MTFLSARKLFFFDLSPWGDEPATDDPTQEEGLDLQILKTFLQEAYKQNKGEKFCYIGGFQSGFINIRSMLEESMKM